MEELLRNGEFLEFFVEGGRTRSGKPLPPKAGLLSVVVDSLMTGVIEDAYIVPVSISYDRLVDGNFVREQMGEPKVYETFWRAVVAIYRVFMGFYGAVRVDFSQPFSLREYMSVYKVYPKSNLQASLSSSGTSLMTDSLTSDKFSSTSLLTEPPSTADLCHRLSDTALDCTAGTETRQLVHCLAEHVVYSCASTVSLMSTHLLALLLLTQHRQGATLGELVVEFELLREEVLSREHDVGFSGETIDILLHAQQMLGSHLVAMTTDPDTATQLDENQLKTVKLVPVTTLPLVIELSYYANTASTIFAVESVLVNVIYSLVGIDEWTNHRHGSHINISHNQLVNQAAHLCTILKYEFLFAPPCRSVESVLVDEIERLCNSNLLMLEQSLTEEQEDNEDCQWAKRFSRNLQCGFDDSDDDTWAVQDETYILCSDSDLMGKFWLLKHIMSPILETYYTAACHLTLLQHSDMPETEFIKSLHSLIKQRVNQQLTTYAECAAIDCIKNALHSFQSLGVISRYDVAGLTMLSLQDLYADDTTLDCFIKHLESYRE